MRSHFLKALVIVLVLLSCSEEEPTPGKIVGKVTLFDKFDIEVPNKEGVIVEIFNESYRQVVSTAANGEFLLDDILPGKYTINFKKENFTGFDSLRFLKKEGIDSLLLIELAEIPPATAQLKHVEYRDDKFYPWTMIQYNAAEWYLASSWYYFSKQPDVSRYRYEYSAYSCCMGGKDNYPTSYAAGLLLESLYKKGFAPGDKVYAVVYSGNSRSIRYHDEAMGYKNYRFPTFSNKPSNVIGFVLP